MSRRATTGGVPVSGRGRRMRSRTRGSAANAGGFTLIEIIVAFAILALGMTLLLGTLSGASRQLRQAGDAGRAALLAQSLLDERDPLLQQPAQWQGTLEDGRYRWQLDVTPWREPRAPSQAQDSQGVDDPFAARLLHVQLLLQWGEGGPQQRLRVSTLRLRLPVPPPSGAAP